MGVRYVLLMFGETKFGGLSAETTACEPEALTRTMTHKGGGLWLTQGQN